MLCASPKNIAGALGWENNVYSVRYDMQNELNSGNKFLLDYNLALPIKPGQEVTLDNDNRLFFIHKLNYE